MGSGLEARFDRYCEAIVQSLGHADRAQPATRYLRGLLLQGDRKSVEPMAARVDPQQVESAHQSMHHLVSTSAWSDEALLAAVKAKVLPLLIEQGQSPCFWIIDDTGFPKKGVHSVGVARQYCGQTGKTDNCRVAVSLSLATAAGSLPLSYALYLPRAWTDDPQRCERAGVPESVSYQTKNSMAVAQVRAAVAAGVPRGVVLAAATYDDDSNLRDELYAQGLHYAVGVKPTTAVWWGVYKPVESARVTGRGLPRARLQRVATHRPISVEQLAKSLPSREFRTIRWHQRTAESWSGRLARVRVVAAHGNRMRALEWLVIEWPKGEAAPTRYWLSTLPESTSFSALVDAIKGRWQIARDHLELKQELGLGHYEGRNWRGFHHHASLCIAAYGFLLLQRLHGTRKPRARLSAPAVPEGFLPRGAGSNATTPTLVDRHPPLLPRSGDRPNSANMSLLPPVTSKNGSAFTTQ